MRDSGAEEKLNLFAIYGTFLLTVSVLVWWCFNSYFGGNYEELLVYTGSDGHCEPASSGFGVHCWGDYFVLRFDSLFSDPHPAEALYPLGGRLLRIPFWIIGKTVGYPFEIGLFLTVSAASCLAPLFLATRGNSRSYRTLVLVVFGTCGVGFLATLDRGNQVGLVVFPLFLICRELTRAVPRIHLASMWFSFVALIKPQFLVLLLLLLVFRRLWLVVLPAFSSITMLAVTQTVFGGGISSVSRMLESQRDWALAGNPGAQDYPTNYSLYRLLAMLGIDVPALGFAVPLLLIMTIVLRRVVMRERLIVADLQVAILIMVIFGTISYGYQAVLAVVVVALAHHDTTSIMHNTSIEKAIRNLPYISAVVLNAPLAVGNSWLGLSGIPAKNMWPLVTTLLISLTALVYGLVVVFASSHNTVRLCE